MSLSNIRDAEYLIIEFHSEGKFNQEMLTAFNNVLTQVEQDESIKAVIITGQDKNFCQGLDLEYIVKLKQDAMNFVEACMMAVGRLLIFPVPVVSAVNGHAFGLGAMITLASDYAVMRSDKGYFCLPEVDIRSNLTPSMNALVSYKLSRLGGRVLRDLLLTGKRVGGIEAEQLSIVDLSCEQDELIHIAKSLPTSMMGKDRKILQQLKTGIHHSILPHNFQK